MSNKDSLVMTAFQTACLAIIVLIAKFTGDLIYNVISEGYSTQRLFEFLMLISLLDFFELTNNWTSIKKYSDKYNGLLFFVDVMTLGCFFWQIYVLSKLNVDPICEHKMKLVIITSYGIVFVLYVAWNIIVLLVNGKKGRNNLEERDKNNIIVYTFVRIFQVVISLRIILVGVENVSMRSLNI